MLSPIQLKKHDFAEISIVANPEVDDSKASDVTCACRHQFGAGPNDDKQLTWMARLRLELLKPEESDTVCLYTGAIEVFGEFEIHPDLPENERAKHIHISGGAMLYSAIREMATLLTARSIHGVIELPSIDPRVFLPKQPESST
ncbi:hypothetical protein SH580_04935 [Coraliomargarita algicola]|uniref:Preprotein translocase subunit SecB n=1 Tax=Coraliomargarita algicola TaxID=3092156 RepID=A0ABZ0RLF9_9BACT|nr:hypothetical protein [Coraliomargarita sp. J2-16]WPJ97049.1 hypothetical protein SH580_04935 [Coraliomargarita sp. J2-16]